MGIPFVNHVFSRRGFATPAFACLSTAFTLAALLLLMVPQRQVMGDDKPFSITMEDMVAIRADSAWEGPEANKFHFEGNFQMRVRDWRVQANSATLMGKLDDPSQLLMEGTPAQLNVSYEVGDRIHSMQGRAREIVYDRESALIRLSGDASLVQDDKQLQSSDIEYDIRSNRFRTTGSAGVRISARPGNQ